MNLNSILQHYVVHIQGPFIIVSNWLQVNFIGIIATILPGKQDQ